MLTTTDPTPSTKPQNNPSEKLVDFALAI